MNRGAKEWDYGNWISYLHFWDNMLWVSSAINGEENWTKVITTPQLDAWCSLTVVHQLVAGEYVYNALCVKPRSNFMLGSLHIVFFYLLYSCAKCKDLEKQVFALSVDSSTWHRPVL